ncbi:MAG TPA: VWA domain-containing protein, partial [Planctomycetota bacterium]|nr:VWA domain-containing protein [Planctomycetota bacterium]
DDCAENNQATVRVLPESDEPRVLALSRSLNLPGAELTRAEHVPPLGAYDAVILDNIDLTKEEQGLLAAYVRSGGGLLLLGGPRSYGRGDWLHRPLEDLSPLKIHPDLKLAVVLGIDASGSMTNDYESLVRMLEEARSTFDDDDDVVGMTFGGTAKIVEVSALRKERPTGGTSIIAGIREARRHLEPRTAGRKAIVLVTDGETLEKPEEIEAAIRELQDIGLTVITTSKNVPGARNRRIQDWSGLRKEFQEVSKDIQDLDRPDPGILDLRAHPITAGVSPVPLREINRTTARPDAQVLATVGVAPKQDPVLAIRPYGQGRVVAFTIGYEPALARLFRQALDDAVGERADGLSLLVDPPLVIARGTSRAAEFMTAGVPVLMKQVGPQRWEGRLPADLTGTVDVRVGRAHAVATIPCPPEFAALGVDRAALDRIAGETGGRVLGSIAELETLPRPEQRAPQSGRTAFLIAALALIFMELGVSIWWKV